MTSPPCESYAQQEHGTPALPDSFFEDEDDEDEDDERFDINVPGVSIKQKKVNRAYDHYNCPIVVVVDTSGIHELRVRPCRCAQNNPISILDQFISSGLYPASMRKTRTVFTFRLLNDYNLDNLESKASARKYYEKLKRLTSNLFPHSVPDRYRELMTVTRQWRDLKARQRAGCAFSSQVSSALGGLALFCPACPQPGINLPPTWKEDKDQYGFAQSPTCHIVTYPYLDRFI